MPGVGALLNAALALALVLAGVHPDSRTWGLHSYAFLPRSAWVVAVLVLLLGLVPAFAARAGALAARVGTLLSRPLVPVAVALVAAPCFFLARLEAQFLGDGTVWVGALAEGKAFHHFEPLAAALVRWLATALAPANPVAAAGALSILLGPFYVVTTAFLCRTVWQEPRRRGLSWLLLLLHPVLLFFCGYVESYPLLLVLEVCFVLALAGAAVRRLPLFVPALILGLALAAHLVAIAWAPALVVLAWSRRATTGAPRVQRGKSKVAGTLVSATAGKPSKGGATARTAAVQGLGALALAFVVAATAAGAVGSSPAALLRDVFGKPGFGGQSFAWMFSLRHAIDVVNETLLLLAPAFVLLVEAVAVSRNNDAVPGMRRIGAIAVVDERARRGAAGRAHSVAEAAADLQPPLWHALVALCLGTLAVALLVEPRIGGARDWDLFVPVALPALLLAVQASSRAPVVNMGRALVLAVVLVVGWLAVGVDAARSAARLEVLQDPRGPFNNFARGYANETLGIYYRGHDDEAARAAWARAAQANPANPRYFNNLGMEELKRENLGAACAAFRRTLELGMDEYFTRFNVANCDRQEGSFVEAERHYDQLIARWPQRWEAFGARGWVRVQLQRPAAALQDLQVAARLAPSQPEVFFSMGLALEALGRADEARAAWERTLQLDPRHKGAREHLQAPGAAAPSTP